MPAPRHPAGNERRDIFFTGVDREVYLGLLKHHAELCRVEVEEFLKRSLKRGLPGRPKKEGAHAAQPSGEEF